MVNHLARVIRERRTIRKFAGQRIPDEVIHQLLNDAAWAPYHSAKEPWRFILFSDKGREAFANAVLTTYTEQELEKYGESARQDYCDNAALHLIVIVKAASRSKLQFGIRNERNRGERVIPLSSFLWENMQPGMLLIGLCYTQ